MIENQDENLGGAHGKEKEKNVFLGLIRAENVSRIEKRRYPKENREMSGIAEQKTPRKLASIGIRIIL